MTRAFAFMIVLAAGVANAAAPQCPAVESPPCCCPPRTPGPAAAAHTRVRQHGRKTCRVTWRTPEVMCEEAARVPRGEIFSTWSNAARQ